MKLITMLEHQNWTHLNLAFGVRRHGYGQVPQCWFGGGCQFCIGLGNVGEIREDIFSLYLYVGSMEAMVLECIANGPGGGYFRIGPKRLFRLLVYGSPTQGLGAGLSDTAALKNDTIRMLGATPNITELFTG